VGIAPSATRRCTLHAPIAVSAAASVIVNQNALHDVIPYHEYAGSQLTKSDGMRRSIPDHGWR